MPDAEQGADVRVPARLGEDALARVQQDDGGLGGRGAGHHVARVLLVSRGVRDDELARLRGEVAVGHVDGDALLALRGEAVHQQREVELVPLGADLRGVGLEGFELILVDQLRVVEEAADERALAVVDAAAGDEAQELLVLVLVEVGLDAVGADLIEVVHQKYPSCFFFSMEAAASWSMTRPSRSEPLVSSISSMTWVRVEASLSTAPVSG